MRKTLIVLALILVFAAPSYVAAQNVGTDDSTTRGSITDDSTSRGSVSGDVCCRIRAWRAGTGSESGSDRYEMVSREKCVTPSDTVGENREIVGAERCYEILEKEGRSVEGIMMDDDDIKDVMEKEMEMEREREVEREGIDDGIERNAAGVPVRALNAQDERSVRPLLDIRKEDSVSDAICCKIYGYGVEMEEVQTRYEWISKDDCAIPEAFVGGNREIVSNDYCAAAVPSREETAAGAVERVKEKVRTFLNTTVLKGTSTPVGPGQFRPADEANVSDEVRMKLEEKRIEVRTKIQENRSEVENIRSEVSERAQERIQDFETRVQAIDDEDKQEIAKRVHERLFDIQEKVLDNFINTLDRLDTVLANISTRAEKYEDSGISVESVKSAVSNAETKIDEARETVKNALRKEYSVEGTTVEALREEFQTVREELKNDLENARNMVRSAHEATRSAAEELAQIAESE